MKTLFFILYDYAKLIKNPATNKKKEC